MVAVLLFSQLFLFGNEIKNNKYKVTYAEGKISFWEIDSNQNFLQEISVGQIGFDSDVIIKPVNHPVWGEGRVMLITEKASGNQNIISLFNSLPFIMLQRLLENQTTSEIRVSKDTMLKGQVSVDETTELKTMSTAGLKPITSSVGGYVYMTVANPENYNGIICGWLSNEKGSGVVFSDYKDNNAELSARIDYGDLRIPAGKTVETEILLIAYAEDIRIGLEQYADAIAKNMQITLPPMPNVYCTWYHGRASDEKKIAANSDFVAEHLSAYGLNVMQIDDYWQSGTRQDGPNRDFSMVDVNGPYPNGMIPTSEYIKNKGMVAGIWYMPFAGTWNDPAWEDKQDLFLKQGKSEFNFFNDFIKKHNINNSFKPGEEPYMARWGGTCLDLTNPKTQDYVRQTSRTLSKEWGYNYFKMDGLWTGTGTRLQYVNTEYKDDDLGLPTRFNPEITAIEAYAKGLDIIRETIGEDVFLLGCSQTQNMRSFGPAIGRVDAMRVGPDNGANPKSLVRGPMFSSRLYFLNKRVWYNDPDPVYVRKVFPEEMAKTSVSWTALTGSLHSSSYQYSELPDDRLDILKRSLPSHNLKTVQPVDFLESDPARVWLLTDDREKMRKDVIGLFNWDIINSANISYKLNRVKLPKADKYVGFDFWENKFMPPFSDSISALLPAGGCKIISVRPVTNFPQVISTSRHLTQGVIDLKNEFWDENKSTLSGISSLIADDAYEIRIVVPTGEESWVFNNISTDVSANDLNIVSSQLGAGIRIKITSTKNRDVKWKVNFKRNTVLHEAENPLSGLHARIDLDKVLIDWDTTSSATCQIIKNGEILGETNLNTFEDKNVKLGTTYQYCVGTKGWDGIWTKPACVTIVMPKEYIMTETPELPSIYCEIPLYVKGNNNIKIDSSYTGTPLTLSTTTYPKGIGVNGNTTLVYNIPEGAEYFVAVGGLDDNVIGNKKSSVILKVFGDVQEMGEPLVEIGRSPILTNDGNRTWNFKIKLDNRMRQLHLLVDSTADGTESDEVDWVNAGFMK